GVVAGRVAGITMDSPVALLYTSGTTGNPKGVLLTHHNVGYELAAAQSLGIIPRGARWVSYLPLAHIAERMFSIYLPVPAGTHVQFCPDTAQLVRVVGKVRPNGFFGVPRVWEKVRAGIEALFALEQDEGKRAAVAGAMATGRRYVEACQYGHTMPPGLAAEFAPAAIEGLLVAHPLIGQALAYGDRRKYVVALVTLDGEVAPAWARARGIDPGSLAELAADPVVLAEVGAAVAAANERLARVQQVKHWQLLPVEWTAETEELTPTLKLRRRIVHAKYADVLDTLYDG